MDHLKRLKMLPKVDSAAFVASGAVVIGDVEIGPDSSVWYGCVLRGDDAAIRIGKGSNVQDLSVLHGETGPNGELPVVIGDNVTIGHRCVIHACIIEDGALIGMGAIVLSGARIGAGSVVAAGAVVKEGMQVPPRSLVVGVPAEVKKTLDEKASARVARNAEIYVELSQAYRALTPKGCSCC